MKYRKKPVVIDAVEWTGKNVIEMAGFCGRHAYVTPEGALIIRTLEGELNASVGDYIIKGVAGEFYPCRGDIFASTYESA